LCVRQVLYISSIVRAVIALHDLVLNKIKFKGEEESKESDTPKDAKDAANKTAGKEETKEAKS
jgi:hypothetical protein